MRNFYRVARGGKVRGTHRVATAGLLAWLFFSADVAGLSTIRLRAGDDLQAALDSARPGDIILLEPGAVFVGNFVLPDKDGDDYITLRTADTGRNLPGEGSRIGPVHARLLATIRSPNASPALQTAPRAHHWRLELIEFAANATPAGDIMRLGDGSSAQSSLQRVPHDLVVDRCYIHGDPHVGQKRGIALNSASTTIVNSYIADIAAAGQDAQAIAGWNGPGPFMIANNYLEASGENFMLGGADPAIHELVPTGVTFTHNHVVKPVSWRGGKWTVKNLFELKNASDVLVEFNLFENNWEAGQAGSAIVFKPVNQDGKSPWSTVRNVVFRSNIVRNVGSAFNILGYDTRHPSGPAIGISIVHNLAYGVDAGKWGGNGAFLQIGDAAADILVDHNTIVQTGNVVVAYGRPTQGFVFRNNLVRHNAYGIKGDSRATGTASIETYLPGATVTHNAFADGPANRYPDGNMFPPFAVWASQFRDFERGDFGLTPASMYRRAATDGEDLGANVEAAMHAAAAALSGVR